MTTPASTSRGVDFSLDNEVGLVTGAASGIGQAIAVGMAASGAQVACLDRPGVDLSSTLDAISRTGGKALPIECDVTLPDHVTHAVEETQSTLGSLSLAVNAAGVADAAAAEHMPLEQWSRLYDINVTGVFLCCQAEGRAMLESGKGAIVNIATLPQCLAPSPTAA